MIVQAVAKLQSINNEYLLESGSGWQFLPHGLAKQPRSNIDEREKCGRNLEREREGKNNTSKENPFFSSRLSVVQNHTSHTWESFVFFFAQLVYFL